MSTIDGAALVKAGGATFHVDMAGDGTPVLLVPGAGGDARQYAELAQVLAQNHTVIAYDRRNNGRSPQQPDWSETSVEQHAGDVIALLETLGTPPCVVFGNSTGALIALAAALKATGRFTGVVLHEPALLGVLASPDDAMATVQPVIAAGVEAGGLAGGAEAFVRFAAGDAVALLPPDFLEGLRTNARVLLEAEFGAFASWRPEPKALAEMSMPLTILSAEQTAPFFLEAAQWIASHAGVSRRAVPGGHMGFLNHPREIAEEIDAML
ncbi:alpha/beta fold hydrolase [Pseudarthrobacter psychrotolerans]|uniref:Alpha/beta fold hydrolase n=1 Tax=Pseudarthrobacter psychrotolerans TaxID=2697569 RepID=A0A6P1NIL9_9MICC|nr:alpha/beta hydrolase [Pseudarthrobacter psychrotolerans]QHK18963.1 alpha/beta fold hydrolase [Pseudarthrobacter psychrotolerans]